MKFFKVLSLLTICFCYSSLLLAASPNLQTPSPVIYLADNLDEERNLGYCLDTRGRGFSERMHAHSCKPRGGDVQFIYQRESSQIRSATFDSKCVVVLGEAAAGSHTTLAAAIRRTRIRPLNVVIKAEAQAKEAQAPRGQGPDARHGRPDRGGA